MQDRAGQFAVETAHVAGEFGEAEVDQAMQLAHAITEILQQPLAQTHPRAQLVGGRIGQLCGQWVFLGGEAGDAQRVDGISLSAFEVLGREAMRTHGIEQGDAMTRGSQSGEQVLPVMSGGFHRDQHFAWRTEQRQRAFIAGGVFTKRRGLECNGAVIGDDRKDVRFGRDIDSRKAHRTSWRRRKSGASEPVLKSTLVHARTRRSRPRDTVRTPSTGRGRQSHARGRRLSAWAATLSRIPSLSILTRLTPMSGQHTSA